MFVQYRDSHALLMVLYYTEALEGFLGIQGYWPKNYTVRGDEGVADWPVISRNY